MSDKQPKSDNKKKSLLKREYHMPLPENKLGSTLGRQVKGPKIWQKFFNYVKDSRQELKKVTWPSRRESLRLTFAVVLFAAFYTGFTVLADFGFERVIQRLFL